MTDNELLALAAKAHGGLVYIDDMGWIHDDKYGNRGSWWNPRENDGDAFRLGVHLNISVDVRLLENEVIADAIYHTAHVDIELCGGDKYAAARRAIFLVAAKVGSEGT